MTERETDFRYQPALDGVRAVAVLAVIAYHSTYAWAKGGFLGVDTFFVLSGFLITTLLVLEWERATSIQLVAFWGRRIRRLLAALLLVIVFVAIYAWFAVPSYQLTKIRLDGLAGLFYVANWRFIATGQSYFDLFAAPSPFKHLWSLAIEEQFYLVWPLIVLACLRLARGKLRVLVGFCVVGIGGSVFLMDALFRADDPSRAYFGTDTRAHTLLVGCLLALLLLTWKPVSRGAKVAVQVVGVLGLLYVVWAMYSIGDLQRSYYGTGSLFFAVAVAAMIAAAVQPGPGFVRTPLSWRPLRWIGTISYGLYLWHWPIDVWLTDTRTGVAGNVLNALRLGVTFVFAIASFYLVERPIRQGRFLGLRRPTLRWVAPAGVVLVLLTLMISTAGATKLPPLFGDASHPFDCPPAGAQATKQAEQALRKDGGAAALPKARGLKVVLVGDSVACSLVPGFTAVGKAAGLEVSQNAVIACGIVSDEVVTGVIPVPTNTSDCPRLLHFALNGPLHVTPHPDVALVLSTWERADLKVGDRTLEAGTKEWERTLQRRLDRLLADFRRVGTHLVITTQASEVGAEFHRPTDADAKAQDAAFDRLNGQLLQFAARHPNDVTLVDLAGKVCPGGTPCPINVDGMAPRPFDGAHFSPQASVWAMQWLLPYVEKAGKQETRGT